MDGVPITHRWDSAVTMLDLAVRRRAQHDLYFSPIEADTLRALLDDESLGAEIIAEFARRIDARTDLLARTVPATETRPMLRGGAP